MGVRYPSLRAMMDRADLHLRYSVRFYFTRYTSPHLFPLSTSGGVMTSSAEFHSFHAFWTEMKPFHISTAADRRTLLSAAVQLVLAQPHGGAAMFTRSTPGCGTLGCPSLVWATSLWPRLRSFDGSPGLRLPSADGQLSGLASDHRMVYA